MVWRPTSVSLTVLAMLQCKSMVQSMLAFAFPQAQADEAEIHLSPALVITDVRQEKVLMFETGQHRKAGIYLSMPYSFWFNYISSKFWHIWLLMVISYVLSTKEREGCADESDSLEMAWPGAPQHYTAPTDNTVLPNTTGKLTPSLHFMQDTETKHGDIMKVIILTFNLGKV